MEQVIRTGTSALPAMLALATFFAVMQANAQQPGPQIMPNYREADLRQVVEAVGEVTGRNFLVDPRVTGQVTFLSYSPMSAEAFYEAFLATLQIHGFIAVESEDVVRIVPDATARVHPGLAEETGGDRIVTQVVQLANVGAAQLVPILRPLIPQYGHLAAHPGSNTLIIVDRGSNVGRMLNIIGRMDQSTDEEIEVIRLENASASEVVTMLGALEQGAVTEGIPPMQIAADDRTNSILLSGPTDRRLRYRALIAHLDTPSGEAGNTQVRYLNYASAEDLAQNLQAQFGSAASAEGAPPESINIWADAGTNSLIINAPARIMQDMNAVIDRLDIRRAQVQVDAIIVELSERRANELGVNWILQGSQENAPVGGTNFSSANAPGILQLASAAAGASGSGATGLSLDPQGLLAAVGRIADSGSSWAALLSALASDTATNIVATPTLVTLDNEEATISVGSEVPFLTGQYGSTAGTVGTLNPFQTISRNPVGTTLTITPQINEGSGVKLVIVQETSSISPAVEGAVDLVTDQRSITTSVFVDDGNILVLGGLIDDQLREVERRVPVLGRIPGLGALFRSQTTELDKTNLMVFIRPTILRDSAQAAFQTDAKYRYIRDLQLQQGEQSVQLMGDAQRPTLPELPPVEAPEPVEENGAGDEPDAESGE
ncbi:MAG: type II secretion system secretin GspD [Rhodospirillaceae bacterium]|nr:type II secretion system secretin GspD [Rhodospirillaceae bacterium]MDD9997543.1 type II secretion system secretin GspD [Rhodospirillaceae bacterium]